MELQWLFALTHSASSLNASWLSGRLETRVINKPAWCLIKQYGNIVLRLIAQPKGERYKSERERETERERERERGREREGDRETEREWETERERERQRGLVYQA